jgi:hypothetical protein
MSREDNQTDLEDWYQWIWQLSLAFGNRYIGLVFVTYILIYCIM